MRKIHPVLVERFAHNLKAERERRGWTHREAAARIGVTYAYLSLLESCQRQPTLEVIEKCAAGMKLSDPSYLLRKVS